MRINKHKKKLQPKINKKGGSDSVSWDTLLQVRADDFPSQSKIKLVDSSSQIKGDIQILETSWDDHFGSDNTLLKKDVHTFCKNIKKKIDVSEQSTFPDFITQQKTLKDLLELIKEKDKDDVQDFIDLFPRPARSGVKNSDGHVFEALWILIFLFKYDNLIGVGYTRQLYKNIESMDKDLSLIHI